MRRKGLPRTDGDLAKLAGRQHGVVSVRQLTQLFGYSEAAVTRAVAAGRLHRLHRGVYAVGHANVSLHGRCLAAVLASGPRALLSHRSAAWLWGILRSSPAPFAVTSPVPRRPRPPIELHHSRVLTDADRTMVENIPVTALPRTLLDNAASARFGQLARMVERSEELGLFDLAPVDDLLARTVGHPGQARLRRAIELHRPTSFTRSQLEARFLELVIAAGLPQPRTNFVEAGFELDCCWPERRFAVELDVFETHGTRAAFERDRVREEELMLAGILVTRVTGPRLEREPRRVIERVARLLELRPRQALE